MTLTLRLFGFEIFHVSTDPEPEDGARDLSGGTLNSTPGFTATWDLPDGTKRPEWE